MVEVPSRVEVTPCHRSNFMCGLFPTFEVTGSSVGVDNFCSLLAFASDCSQPPWVVVTKDAA